MGRVLSHWMMRKSTHPRPTARKQDAAIAPPPCVPVARLVALCVAAVAVGCGTCSSGGGGAESFYKYIAAGRASVQDIYAEHSDQLALLVCVICVS